MNTYTYDRNICKLDYTNWTYWHYNFTEAPCLNAPVICVPVTSPVNKFAEIASRSQIMSLRPIDK